MYSKVIQIYILFQILFPYRSFQNTECHSLYYIVGYRCLSILYIAVCMWSFPGGLVSKEFTCIAADQGSIPGLGKFPGVGSGN